MDGDCIIHTHQHKAIQTKYVKVNVQYVRQGPFTIFHQLWVWVEVRFPVSVSHSLFEFQSSARNGDFCQNEGSRSPKKKAGNGI